MDALTLGVAGSAAAAAYLYAHWVRPERRVAIPRILYLADLLGEGAQHFRDLQDWMSGRQVSVQLPALGVYDPFPVFIERSGWFGRLLQNLLCFKRDTMAVVQFTRVPAAVPAAGGDTRQPFVRDLDPRHVIDARLGSFDLLTVGGRRSLLLPTVVSARAHFDYSDSLYRYLLSRFRSPGDLANVREICSRLLGLNLGDNRDVIVEGTVTLWRLRAQYLAWRDRFLSATVPGF